MERERDWSTREKLAIVSFAGRAGENEWVGAERFLEPFCEIGRPTEWLEAAACAHQFRALIRQHAEHNGGDPNLESPEKSVIESLTETRIIELEEQLRKEREEYFRIEKELELVQAGDLDDKLDELLKLHKRDTDVANNNCVAEPTSEKEVVLEAAESEEYAPPAIDYGDAKMRTSSPEKANSVEKESYSQALENVNAVELSAEESGKFDPEIPDPSNKISASDVTEPCKVESPSKTEYPPSESKSSVLESVETMAPENSEITTEIKLVQTPEEANTVATELELPSNESCCEPLPAEPNIAIEGGVDTEVVPPKKKSDAKTASQVSGTEKDSEPLPELIEENKSVCNETPTDVDDSQAEVTPVNSPSQSPSTEADNKPPSSKPPEVSKSLLAQDNHPISAVKTKADGANRPASEKTLKSDTEANDNALYKAWKKSIMILWKQIASHRYASLFMQPVTDDIAPNYSTTVYRAMDLTTIKKNVENGVIRTTSSFQRDLMLMFQNALMYNSKDHDVYKMTTDMQSEVMNQVAQFLATQIMAGSDRPSSSKGRLRPHGSPVKTKGHIYATSDVLLSVLVREARSKRIAAIEGETRFMRKKNPSYDA